MEVWERVPWCSKSFSPRRGRVGWVEEDVLGGLLGMRGIEGGGRGEGGGVRREGGEEAEVLGFVAEVCLCRVGRGEVGRFFV